MKKFNFFSLILVGFLIVISFLPAKAQDETPNASNQQTDGERRPKLLEQLNLSAEQIQQIRRINIEKKPLLREAQNRLREANRNLDRAIYADNSNENDIQASIKEVQKAHSEVIRIRSLNELAVRRILTAEQLVKFRDFRERNMTEKNNRQNQRRNQRMELKKRSPDAPNRLFKNRRRFPRSSN
jgi:Spy/CpxP family protein refolding chaperone